MIPRLLHGIFVVRVWLEPTEGGAGGAEGGVWRASVTDVRSRERTHFSEPAALARFLAACPDGGEDAPR